MVRRSERSARDAGNRLHRMDVAVRRAVVLDHVPGQRRCRQRSLLGISGVTGERDRVANLPGECRARRVDECRRETVAHGDCDRVAHARDAVVVGDLKTCLIAAVRRVREERLRGRRIVEIAVAVEIPSVGERVSGMRGNRSGSVELDVERSRARGGIRGGDRVRRGVLHPPERAASEVDVKEVAARTDLEIHRCRGPRDEGESPSGIGLPAGVGQHRPDAAARVVREEEGSVVAGGISAAAIEREAGDRRAPRRAGLSGDDRVGVLVGIEGRRRVPGRIEVGADGEAASRVGRLGVIALVAGPAEILGRIERIRQLVDLLPVAPSDVSDPYRSRARLDGEPEGISQTVGDDSARDLVARTGQRIVRQRVAVVVHSEYGAARERRAALHAQETLRAQRAALGRRRRLRPRAAPADRPGGSSGCRTGRSRRSWCWRRRRR